MSHGHKNVHEGLRELSKTEKSVFEAIRSNNIATAKQIASLIDKSEKTVYRAISVLKNLGYISREGNDFDGKWVIRKVKAN